MSKLLNAIEEAIKASDKSRYRIAQETGIDEGRLSRFMSGETGLSVEAVETLADYLDIEIIIRARATKAGNRKKAR